MLALIIVLIVMIALTFAVFGGIWQFWMWFPILGVSIAVLITGIYYIYYKTRS
ncbi:MAG: hypothetical protein ACFFD5_05340 [Candidatus Thorarchaeota archaeon]